MKSDYREIHLVNRVILVQDGFYFGKPMTFACDANCDKAWGIGNRPHIQLSDDEDDIVWLADSELGEAPNHPNSWEGEDTKPQAPEERMNKWCCRACERSTMSDRDKVIHLTDWSKRVYNLKSRQAIQSDKNE